MQKQENNQNGQNTLVEIGNYIINKDQIVDKTSGNIVTYLGYNKDKPDLILSVKQRPYQQQNQEMVEYINREIKIMSSIKSKYVVRFKSFKKTSQNIYIFFEYPNQGSLNKYISQNGQDNKLDLQTCLQFFYELQEGFKPIYNANIMHRDIKLENIYVHNHHIKISGFGFGKILTDYEYEETKSHTLLGCIEYMAPELLTQYIKLSQQQQKQQNQNNNQEIEQEDDEVQYSPKCDVWSMGVVFYQMLTGNKPYQNSNNIQLWLNSMQKDQLEFPNGTPQLVIDLITKMLRFDESKRLSWLEVFQHELFVQLQQDKSREESFASQFSTTSMKKQQIE